MKHLIFFSLAMYIGQFTAQSPLVIGHRGCRGYYPENSIIAFQKALEQGVQGIEIDVVVNKDRQLVISHEPYFKSEFCLAPGGKEIKDEKVYNLYNMTQAEIATFDCGSKGNTKFPEQQRTSVIKPLFQDFVKEVITRPTTLLFEIKSEPKEYGISQPNPKEFVELILKEVANYPYPETLYFMCFDAQLLNELHRQAPNSKMVYLTYLPKSAENQQKQLTFKPFAFGMFYPTVKKRDVMYVKKNNIQLFTWTVNDENKAKKLAKMGVDALITDYPKRILEAIK
jgi:glycerophosphoryl diester phosphodiesterase